MASSLNKTLAENQEMEPTSEPNEPTTRQSSDEVWAFLDELKGRQLTDEQKNNILIIKAALRWVVWLEWCLWPFYI